MRHIEATDRCDNCGAEFADHNYVADSIDTYLCPYERQMNQGYGYGYSKDRPDCFSPDYESCSEAELANYKRALEHFEKCKQNGQAFVCPPGSWGIGVYWDSEQTQFKLHLPDDTSQAVFEFE